MGWDTQTPVGASTDGVAQMGTTLRSGTTAENLAYVGAVGEMTHDNQLNLCRFHDGTTPGGLVLSLPSFSGALVRLTANQGSLGFNNFEVLAFDTAVYDTGNYWDMFMPTEFTIPAGIDFAQMNITITFTGSNVGELRGLRMLKNGDEMSLANPGMARHMGPERDVSGPASINATSAFMPVVPGDKFEVEVVHDIGATSGVIIGNDNMTWMSIRGLRA